MKEFVWWFNKRAGAEHHKALESAATMSAGSVWIGLLGWAFEIGSPVSYFLLAALPTIGVIVLLFAEYRSHVARERGEWN